MHNAMERPAGGVGHLAEPAPTVVDAGAVGALLESDREIDVVVVVDAYERPVENSFMTLVSARGRKS